MLKVKPRFEWEKVVLAKYYLECNESIDLSNVDLTKLKPWMIAEVARINSLTGLLKIENGSHWDNFFNTAYVSLLWKLMLITSPC